MAETAEAKRSDDRRKETKPSAHDHFSWTVLPFWNSKRGSNAASLTCPATRKERRISWTMRSSLLRTFENARLEVVTYVEAKFGLRIRDSKPSDTGARGHSDPMDVDAANSLSSTKGSPSSGDGCFKCGGAHFQRDCNARKSTGKQSYGKGKQSKSWSKSEPSLSGKGKSKENNGKSKGKSKRNRKCEPRCKRLTQKAKTSNTVSLRS